MSPNNKPKRCPHTKGLRTYVEDATKESAIADYMSYKQGGLQSNVKSRRIKNSGGGCCGK